MSGNVDREFGGGDPSSPRRPMIRLAGGIDLTPEVETVLRAMFAGFEQVAVETEFGRGFSGSRAFRVRLIQKGGRNRLPAVVKIAPTGLIRDEWQAYQSRVEYTLPNIARLESPPVLPAGSHWGGLHYALVGAGTFAVQSLRDYYREASIEDLCWVLESRLFEILGANWWLDSRADRAFQMQADYDILLPVNLLVNFSPLPVRKNARVLEAGHNSWNAASIGAGDPVQLKGFVIDKVDLRRQQLTLNAPPAPPGQLSPSYRVRLNQVPDIEGYRVNQTLEVVEGIVNATRRDLLLIEARRAMGQSIDLSAEKLRPSSDLSLPNPLLAYQELLHNFLTVNISTVHGDLNLENILIDPATREVSLIDFATVRQGHTLHDLLRLETEVVVSLIPAALLETGLPPEAICFFYEHVHQATVYPDESLPGALPHPNLEKPFRMLATIRRMARKCLFNLDEWQEYYQGLVLYLLGSLKFSALDDGPSASLPKQTAFWAAAATQNFLKSDLVGRQKPQPDRPSWVRPSISPELGEAGFALEPPFGAMHPESKFYIERPADEQCSREAAGVFATTLFVQAPMQMGKSSLMHRVLHQTRQAQGKPFAYIDFQKFTEQSLADEERFFIEFCLMIGDALGVPEAIDRYWSGKRTNIVKCSMYLSEHIIPDLKEVFILGMDEVERMLTSPFRTNFFGMLRSWHNDRVYNQNLARMSLFLSSSTDPYLLIDNPNQSPFNVAILISLQDFTEEEVAELNRRHRSPLNPGEAKQLMDLVGGHPFLTRLALYQLALGKIDLPTLLAQATDDAGPFGDHLRHYLSRVMRKPELRQAILDIYRRDFVEDNHLFYRLKEAGLIKKVGTQIVFRNTLYERYFRERLNV